MAIFLEVVTRLGFLSMPCHRHCQPCRASPLFFRPFSVLPVGDGLHSSESIELRNGPFFFSRLPRSRLWGPCFRSVGLFPSWLEWWLPLVEVFGGVSRSPSSAGRFSPIQVPWVPVYLVSLALGLSSCCLRHVQVACSYCCRSRSSHPSPAWFSTKTSASWVSTVSSAPDSEQTFTFGLFSLLRFPSSASSPSTLVASWSSG